MNDPFISGARALLASLRSGMISQDTYDSMYAAIAAAAEADAVRCDMPGCADPAYIGTRCAAHFDRSTLPAIVAQLRERHV